MEDRHVVVEVNEIYHHGVKDQKWGKRRFQNYDGSLTPEGRIHYGVGERKKHGIQRFQNSDGSLNAKGVKKYGADKKGDAVQLTLGKMQKQMHDEGSKEMKRASKNLKYLDKHSKKYSEDERLKLREQYENDEAEAGKKLSAATLLQNMNQSYTNMLDDERDHIRSGKATADGLWDDPIAWNSAMVNLVKKTFNDGESTGKIKKEVFEDGPMKDLLQDETQQRANIKYEKEQKQKRIAENKKTFTKDCEDIRKKGMNAWFNRKLKNNESTDSFFNYVLDTQSKIIDDWYDYNSSHDYTRDDWYAEQRKYSKKLANDLGLPQSKETYEFLADWFFTGDD